MFAVEFGRDRLCAVGPGRTPSFEWHASCHMPRDQHVEVELCLSLLMMRVRGPVAIYFLRKRSSRTTSAPSSGCTGSSGSCSGAAGGGTASAEGAAAEGRFLAGASLAASDGSN